MTKDTLLCNIPDGKYYFKFQDKNDRIIYLKGYCDYFANAKDIKEKYLKEAKKKYGDHIYIISHKITTFN